MNTKERIWTKDYTLMLTINFILMSIFYLLIVTMASFATDSFNVSPSIAGLVSGIYIIGTVGGRLLTGNIINKVGSKKVLIIGLIAFVLTTLLYFVSLNIGILLLSRFVNGFAVGIAANAVGTIVAQITPNSRKSEGIGYFSMSLSVATAIGPFLGLVLNQNFSYQVIFALCFILALVSLIIAFVSSIKNKKFEETSSNSKSKWSISNFIDIKTLPIGILILLFALGYSSLISFLSFFAEERNIVSYASMFFIVYSVVVLLTRPITGKLMDQKGANIIVYPCIILYFIGMILLGFSTLGFMLLIAAIIIGLGYGNLFSAHQTIAVKVAEPQNVGLATSTFFIFFDLGLGFGPYFLGLIVPHLGYAGLYITLGIIMLLLIIPYYFFYGRYDRQYR
ncbi:MFS transporter [Staphylococcus kloosii]|uniref:MFS transporter n=1 Tax=Staphylococcus kloosii TaxID=29384 RepID=A0ABQ0XM57_9STAP|nr:MFS transporter [Staphylococcus kloosii]AVQ34759.1 MFS transporter [Staphylococcus kloosii]PNZ06667.1 MFS transporter [Staphylococcus kloosii]PTJ75005.1 MFS transporter [Staphylococcus kloosii]SUM50317.1 major facilitator family transporter [Staphylococcus kloosii]GEP81958.1 MFS transporter [Staphylococcus kloosii]